MTRDKRCPPQPSTSQNPGLPPHSRPKSNSPRSDPRPPQFPVRLLPRLAVRRRPRQANRQEPTHHPLAPQSHQAVRHLPRPPVHAGRGKGYAKDKYGLTIKLDHCRHQAPNLFEVNLDHPLWDTSRTHSIRESRKSGPRSLSRCAKVAMPKPPAASRRISPAGWKRIWFSVANGGMAQSDHFRTLLRQGVDVFEIRGVFLSPFTMHPK